MGRRVAETILASNRMASFQENACDKQDCLNEIKAVVGDGRILEPTVLRVHDELSELMWSSRTADAGACESARSSDCFAWMTFLQQKSGRSLWEAAGCLLLSRALPQHLLVFPSSLLFQFLSI